MTEVTDTSSAAATDTADETLPPPGRGPRRLFVRLAVAAAVIFTLVAVGMLGTRWWQVQIPDMTIVIRGDKDAQGTEVVVRNEDEHREIARSTLTAANNYEFIVMIERHERHTVRATLGTHVLLEAPVPMPASGNVMVEITVPPELRAHSATAPTKPSTPGPAS